VDLRRHDNIATEHGGVLSIKPLPPRGSQPTTTRLRQRRHPPSALRILDLALTANHDGSVQGGTRRAARDGRALRGQRGRPRRHRRPDLQDVRIAVAEYRSPVGRSPAATRSHLHHRRRPHDDELRALLRQDSSRSGAPHLLRDLPSSDLEVDDLRLVSASSTSATMSDTAPPSRLPRTA